MPTCILGMHRSGTSMLSRALAVAGLYLGAERDFMLASDESPDGYWENARFVAVNEELLDALGGGWDRPPAPPENWAAGPPGELAELGEDLVETFAGREPWGWKDPRTSLTLPFWLSLVPDLRVVVCVRNPLEVALSLQRRGSFSFGLSFELWHTYNQRLLAALASREFLVVSYEALLEAPVEGLRRAVAHAGLRPGAEEQAAAACFDSTRRHHRFSIQDVRNAGASIEITDLYLELVELAGKSAAVLGGERKSVSPPVQGIQPRTVQAGAIERELLRREVTNLKGGLAHRDAAIATLADQVDEARAQVARLEAGRDELRAEVETQAEAEPRPAVSQP